MKTWIRASLLIAGLGIAPLLAGCPGMPGGGGGQAQQTPPGVLPPPGLKSGGVRTLVGATVTPPDGQVLLVQYQRMSTFASGPGAATPGKQAWTSARRISVTENTVLLEGLNFDGRTAGQEKDTNLVIPIYQISMLDWKYAATSTAPSAPAPTAEGKTPAPAPSGESKQPAKGK